MGNLGSWRVNAPAVISEAVEGEAIAINLENGIYYTFNAVGSFLWQELLAQRSLTEAAAFLSGIVEKDISLIAADVQAFLQSLLAEQLICPNEACQDGVTPAEFSLSMEIYEDPKFNRFDDLNALLLADPIHDVSEVGWPHMNPSEPVLNK